MAGAGCLEPTSEGLVRKRQATTNAQEQEFVRDSPVVAHAYVVLDPDETRLVGKPPGLHDLPGLEEEAVGGPEM